ncbi:MAG: uroporphyrinogen decarboxylase [Gammaproteobacteria bacterium]|nr:uroporphyrinogen decarboxylase [Gammaproteobacteria bacterium]
MQDPLFIRALRRQVVERTPVWLMRQAGRYLPEYRQVRAQAGDFLSLCKTPRLASEVTLQPLRRFSLDAAIVFSDILTIPDAMGLGLHFVEGEGPQFHQPLTRLESVESFKVDDIVQRVSYVMETIQLVRAQMPAELPLIGFSGSPWTLACYMVEGQSSRSFSRMLCEMYAHADETHRLLSWLADVVVLYLQAQIQAGVQAVMVFDTWGGLLNPANYRAFSLAYMQRIVDGIRRSSPDMPVILFTKGVGSSLVDLANIGPAAVGVDWTLDLQQVRAAVGDRVAIQGNLDPSVLLTSPQTIEREVMRVLDAFGHGSGHIFNLGHGITPDVPPEHVAVMVEAVHRLSPAFHGGVI